MIWNYFIIAWRNLIRRKIFSAINILGLAIAMAFSIVIFLWIVNELKYDQFHLGSNRRFRVLQTQYYKDGKISTSERTPAQLASALKTEMPEVEMAAMMSATDPYSLKVDAKVERAQGCYASEDFFLMFSFPFIRGDSRNCLSAPDQIVIAEKLAGKYFGKENPLGKTIRIDNRKDFYVSGVFADLPEHSSLQFDFVLPYKEYEDAPWAKDWEAIGDKTFLLLRENASPNSLDDKIKYFLKSKMAETTDQLLLQPFSEMHLYSNFENGVQDGGRIEYVRIFSIVAILILGVACINFMNLSTAHSFRRSKEVGIRKVVGASKSRLVTQFMAEAILTAWLSLVVALCLAETTLPYFRRLTGIDLKLEYAEPVFILVLFALATITGVVAGSYPSLFLSSLQPVKILKGTLKFKSAAIDFRKALIVFQFSLSMLFIFATIIVYQQVQYIYTKNLGVDRENIVYQIFEGDLTKNFNAYKALLSQSPGIQSITYSNQPILSIQHPTTWVEWPGKERVVVFAYAGISYDYIKTMKIQLLEGRDFSPENKTDSSNVLINEEAARQMGILEPLGHEITTRREITRKGKIIGIMKDFHLQSLHAPIEPLLLFFDTYPGFGYVTVRTEPGKTKEALASMESASKKYNPDFPFDYTFADVDFKEKYITENLLGELTRAFSCLTIFISCLGLFGLTAFSAEQRIREFGIRKVLGASVFSIVRLLSKDFVKLLLFAYVIAVPGAWYLMNQWLEDYAYRIEITWWIFAVAGGVAFLVAIVTVGAQAAKAATRNPVDALKVE